MSTWGGSLTTASQSDVTGGGHNAEERADIEAAEIPSVSSQVTARNNLQTNLQLILNYCTN